MTGAPDPSAALAALYPSTVKADAPAPTPGSTAPKAAATTPAPTPAAAKPSPGTWAAPDGTPPAKAAQPEPPRDPAATLYAEPMKTFADVVAATPLPEGDAEAAGFDISEEGKAAREAVRSAFLASGASKEETSELWGIAAEAAHPNYQPETYEAAETTLRREWKGDFDSRLNRARTLMRDMARKHPAVASEIKKLGLDNSARFIAAVEKAARRRGR